MASSRPNVHRLPRREVWRFRETESAFLTMQLVRGNRALGLVALRARGEGMGWADVLVEVRRALAVDNALAAAKAMLG